MFDNKNHMLSVKQCQICFLSEKFIDVANTMRINVIVRGRDRFPMTSRILSEYPCRHCVSEFLAPKSCQAGPIRSGKILPRRPSPTFQVKYFKIITAVIGGGSVSHRSRGNACPRKCQGAPLLAAS